MTERTDGYRVKVTARTARDLDRLPEKIATACVEFIFGPLAANPQRLGKPLTGLLAGQHSTRRGTYRVVHRLRDQTIEIVHIGHRGTSYKQCPCVTGASLHTAGHGLLASAVAMPSDLHASSSFWSPAATTRSSSSSCSADAQWTAS